jgi:hypothetical protein
MSDSARRPLTVWLLVAALLFLAFGGLYGGIGMLADPSGRGLAMDEVLPLLPVPDYRLPGLFLIVVMGLAPLLLVYGLLARPNWSWAQALARWSGHDWAWTGTLALGLVLAAWLAVQAAFIGFRWPIQYITAVNGLIIIGLALMPGVRRNYAR